MTNVKRNSVAELRAAAERLLRIADDLEADEAHSIHEGKSRNTHQVKRSMFPGLGSQEMLSQAKFMYESRARRTTYFESAVFGEPCWDIILDLLISKLSEKNNSITSACIAANVAPTTALRWVHHMVELGLLVRDDCLTDNRRSYVTLSDSAFKSFVKYFADLKNDRHTAESYANNYLINIK